MCNCLLVFLVVFQAYLGLAPMVSAQSKNETVSKTVKQNLPVATGNVFQVITEKADVQITGWTKQYMQMQIVFSATHPNKQVATREVDFMQYALSREQNVVELRNGFFLPAAADTIQSKLAVSIVLMVPSTQRLVVKSKYGNVALRNLAGNAHVDLDFSDLELGQVRGEWALQASFSEIRGQDINTTSFKSKDSRCQFFLDLSVEVQRR